MGTTLLNSDRTELYEADIKIYTFANLTKTFPLSAQISDVWS